MSIIYFSVISFRVFSYKNKHMKNHLILRFAFYTSHIAVCISHLFYVVFVFVCPLSTLSIYLSLSFRAFILFLMQCQKNKKKSFCVGAKAIYRITYTHVFANFRTTTIDPNISNVFRICVNET